MEGAVCACERLSGVVLEEFEGACLVVVSGDFCVAGAVVDGGWVCASRGDCAKAAVAKTRPIAVVKRRRVFIWNLLLIIRLE